MANDETNNRPRSRLRDYAGLAALVTAIGAVAFGVIDRVGHEDKADRMQRSIFNAGRERIAVLEYRVKQLEERCEAAEAEVEPARARHPRPARAARAAGVSRLFGAGGEAEPAAPDPAELADEAVAELDAAAEGEAPPEPPSFDDIQRIVQSGKVYGDATVEDKAR